MQASSESEQERTVDALAHNDEEGRSKPAKVIGKVQTTVIPDRLRMRQLNISLLE
jgi:hypothetical protein